MQACIFTVGILLFGQVGGLSGDRYSGVPPATPAGGDTLESQQAPTGQQPWNDQSTELQSAATAPVGNPLRPANPPAATSPARLTKVTQAAELLSTLAKPVGREKLGGVPLSLAEAVQNARSRAEQTLRVNRYWELSQAVTEFHLVSQEELELQSLRSGLAQASQAWGLAQQAVAARKRVAQSAVQVAQFCLQQELGRTDASNLPLPSDLPHCGAYQTKYEQIFQGRTSREAQQLGQLLPLRHQELGQRALEATRVREWLLLVMQQRSPQSDGTQLLKAYEQLALQRRAFVATAYQYNANIARYAELAVPQEIGTVRLVAMLIQSEGNAGVDWQRGAIQRASAEEELSSSKNPRHQRTYAEPGRSETRRVPTGQEKGEHSILVAPPE